MVSTKRLYFSFNISFLLLLIEPYHYSIPCLLTTKKFSPNILAFLDRSNLEEVTLSKNEIANLKAEIRVLNTKN